MKLVNYLFTAFLIICYELKTINSEVFQTNRTNRDLSIEKNEYQIDLSKCSIQPNKADITAQNKNNQIYSLATKNSELLRERKTRQSSRYDLNLKNILKTSGSMSLSEILQQKNLSLQDLLTGKNSALQAIRSPKSTSTTPAFKVTRKPIFQLSSTISTLDFKTNDKYVNIEPQILKNKEDEKYKDKSYIITAQKDSVKHSEVLQSRLITRKPTVKIVASKSVINQTKDNIENNEAISATYVSEDSKLNKKKTIITPELNYIYKTPVKTFQITTDSRLENYTNTDYKNKIETNAMLFLDLLSVPNIDERSELIELIKDGKSSSRLLKVLNQRNMTLDELVEHRKRGSSQLHLSQYINDKSSSLISSTNLKQNLDIVTSFENFPHFSFVNIKNIKPDDIEINSEGYSHFSSISSEVLPGLKLKNGKALK